MSVLLDTNFLIGILRGSQPYWEYLEKLLETSAPEISAITRAEIYAGCHPSETGPTERLLGCFRCLPVGSEVADIAGGYVYIFDRRGVTLHLEDAVIGATVVYHQLVLITQNVRHFPMLSVGKNLIRFPTR
jgi:predicted nucleic acid-binding protein